MMPGSNVIPVSNDLTNDLTPEERFFTGVFAEDSSYSMGSSMSPSLSNVVTPPPVTTSHSSTELAEPLPYTGKLLTELEQTKAEQKREHDRAQELQELERTPASERKRKVPKRKTPDETPQQKDLSPSEAKKEQLIRRAKRASEARERNAALSRIFTSTIAAYIVEEDSQVRGKTLTDKVKDTINTFKASFADLVSGNSYAMVTHLLNPPKAYLYDATKTAKDRAAIYAKDKPAANSASSSRSVSDPTSIQSKSTAQRNNSQESGYHIRKAEIARKSRAKSKHFMQLAAGAVTAFSEKERLYNEDREILPLFADKCTAMITAFKTTISGIVNKKKVRVDRVVQDYRTARETLGFPIHKEPANVSKASVAPKAKVYPQRVSAGTQTAPLGEDATGMELVSSAHDTLNRAIGIYLLEGNANSPGIVALLCTAQSALAAAISMQQQQGAAEQQQHRADIFQANTVPNIPALWQDRLSPRQFSPTPETMLPTLSVHGNLLSDTGVPNAPRIR